MSVSGKLAHGEIEPSPRAFWQLSAAQCIQIVPLKRWTFVGETAYVWRNGRSRNLAIEFFSELLSHFCRPRGDLISIFSYWVFSVSFHRALLKNPHKQRCLGGIGGEEEMVGMTG